MNKGITLIETLVVIAILGILISVGMSAFSGNETPCEKFSNRPMKNIPVKCLGYFNNLNK